MKDFDELPDLAAERLGGTVPFANDEFFAGKENLLREPAAIFVPDRYTEQGKWMDGWESRRRRTPGHDFAIVRLGLPGVLKGAIVDTAHFKGNFPAACSLDACDAGEGDSLADPAGERWPWIEILPQSALAGDTANRFELTDPRRFTHVRLNIYPDGGIARLRVWGSARL
jgi:allantoicase